MMENLEFFETDTLKSENEPLSSSCGGLATKLSSSKVKSSSDSEVVEHEIACRLCAVVSSSSNVDSSGTGDLGWTKISNKWLNTAETIDFVMKKYFPVGLMTTKLSNEKWMQFICPTCFKSLQQLKDFIDLIKKGQEEILKLLQQQSGCTSNDIPRKRGRPRKDAKNAKLTTTNETMKIEQREKRTSRPPKRYGSETVVSENPSNMTTDIVQEESEEIHVLNGSVVDEDGALNFQLLDNEIVHFPGVYAEVIVEDTSTLDNQSFLVMQSEENNEILSTETNYNQAQTDEDGNEPMEDKSDGNFTLSTFRRKQFGRKKKRGRPKKINVRQYKCELCEKVFTAYALLVYHQLSNHQENTQDLCCTLCNKQFAHKALLANHMFTHSSTKAFICEEGDCKSSFRSRAGLYNHKRTVHNENGNKMFTCDLCGTQFTSKAALQAHQRLHTGERPFQCKFCDKSFNHAGNMKEHVRTHTKEKPYACDVSECGRCFATNSQLRTHKMRHLETKSFVCAECGKCFSQRNGLVIHMKSHKGISLKCSMCSKEFIDSSALKKHQRIHSGEKPYKCGVCNKSFSDPSNFRKHQQIHQKNKKAFADNDFLRTEGKQGNPSRSIPVEDTHHVHPSTDIPSKDTPIMPGGSSDNVVETTLSATSDFQETDSGAVAEPYLQIMTQEELAALSIDASSSDGNIIILYQPDELFSVPVDETQSLEVPAQAGETVVLGEVEEIEGLESIHDISLVETSTQKSTLDQDNAAE